MAKTLIVSTMGPAINNRGAIKSLISAGVDIFRFNFSHAKKENPFDEELAIISELNKEMNRDVKILADIQGPKIRVGTFAKGREELKQGEPFTLTVNPVQGTDKIVQIDHSGICGDVKEGSIILINDGILRLEVTGVTDTEVNTKVIYGGIISDRKGVNLPGSKVSLPAMTEKDLKDLAYIGGKGFDYIAASFVRKGEDVSNVIRAARENGSDAKIISKIETREAIENIRSIVDVSDGVLVARGDMAIEMPYEYLPVIQKVLIKLCNGKGKFVITATQMLESMINNPVPTRAEITDVANAVLDGTDAVMLSAETAMGKYPVEAVTAMERILRSTEKAWEDGKMTFSDVI
ncbi:MAG TPA: pyruvate kinase [Spirochaetota bacterium]|nr:pyruvate kinase [Spirochaetota bacterium]